jgi:hypothetical protein
LRQKRRRVTMENNNPEPTSPVDHTHITSKPYLADYVTWASVPHPPPPSKGNRFKKIGLSLLVAISILLASTFTYIIGFESGTTTHRQNSSASRPISIGSGGAPALQHTPTQVTPPNNGSGLYSQDFKSFYTAFTQDLTNGMFDLGGSVGSSFQLACDNTTTPPCTYGWSDVYQMLKGGHLIFHYPCDGPGTCPIDGAYTNDSCKNIPYPVRAYTYTVEKYDQDGSINAPNIGESVFAFVDEAINANTNQWLWDGVILQSAC